MNIRHVVEGIRRFLALGRALITIPRLALINGSYQ